VTLDQATQKAAHLAESGPAVIVSVADPAHGDGVGENRFDAVTLAVYEDDRRGGRYLTLEKIVTKEARNGTARN
jgi:hypothetical protein